jgi:hypothetical protein
MIGIQILAILFVLWMTYFSFLHYRRKEFSFWEFTFWQTAWIGLAVVVIFPKTTGFITRTFGFYRALDFLTVGAIVILLGVTFRNYVLLRRLERQLQEAVRKIALGKE